MIEGLWYSMQPHISRPMPVYPSYIYDPSAHADSQWTAGQQWDNTSSLPIAPYDQSVSSYPSAQIPSAATPTPTAATLLLQIPSEQKRAILLHHIATFQHSYAFNDPKSNHLLSLTRVNVHRAFVANMASLGLSWDWMEEESISPFPMVRPGCDINTKAVEGMLPAGLRPTALQRSRPHHPWIDFFPSPVMRDNLLLALDEWDEDDMCTDIMGFWEGGATGPFGLVVWGEPGDPANWEVTEGFVRKWGWVVGGCEQLMRATNAWRARRGERPLFRVGGNYQRNQRDVFNVYSQLDIG